MLRVINHPSSLFKAPPPLLPSQSRTPSRPPIPPPPLPPRSVLLSLRHAPSLWTRRGITRRMGAYVPPYTAQRRPCSRRSKMQLAALPPPPAHRLAAPPPLAPAALRTLPPMALLLTYTPPLPLPHPTPFPPPLFRLFLQVDGIPAAFSTYLVPLPRSTTFLFYSILSSYLVVTI
ncbi:hypothetical protein C8R43DRAFT_1124513 [Mycena crocata]|nr:hypothetical protein C8R43DRAFT_1124513 [Mycena crocata]